MLLFSSLAPSIAASFTSINQSIIVQVTLMEAIMSLTRTYHEILLGHPYAKRVETVKIKTLYALCTIVNYSFFKARSAHS